MKRIGLGASALAISLIFSGCGNSTEQSIEETVQVDSTLAKDTSKVDELAQFKFQITIGNIPYPPGDMFAIVSKTNAAFDKALVNPTENSAKYATTAKKSFNYGVYSVDLIYLAATGQLEGLKSYFNTTRELSKQLDMVENFDKITKKHSEKAIESKDSIITVVNEVFSATDGYLRSNEMLTAATEILVGSWVESQFVILNVLKNTTPSASNAELFDKVFEQKLHTGNLVNLLEEYKKDKDLSEIGADFKKIQEEYAKIKTKEEVSKHISDILSKLTLLRNKLIS